MAAPDDPLPVSESGATDNNRDSNIKKTLTEARRLFMKHQEHSEALKAILKAVKMCECSAAKDEKARHGKDKSCHISQCLIALQSEDPDALEQVANGPCACGYPWPTCARPLHAQSLDALAECLNAAEQHVNAISTALGIIRLDPASAMGYCRVAKIIGQLLKPSSHPNVAKVVAFLVKEANLAAPDMLCEVLCSVVRTGLHVTAKYRHGLQGSYNVVLQQMAHRLKIKAARRDPVKSFPPEVLSMIFSHLGITNLVKCLQVSRQWNHIVMRDAALWTDLRLTKPGNPGRCLSTFLQKHQGIKSFVVHDSSLFSLTGAKIRTIFYGLPALKRLCLINGPRRLADDEVLNFPTEPRSGAKLTHLSLTGFNNPEPVRKLVERTCNTLVILDLVDINGQANSILRSLVLPRLKTLRVVQQGYPSRPGPSTLFPIEMQPIVAATPNLEQFHLSGFTMQWLREPTPDHAALRKNGLWPSLNKLRLGPNAPPLSSWRSRALPPLTSNMRSIELIGANPDLAHNVLFAQDWPSMHMSDPLPVEPEPFPNLEVFRCMSGLLQHDGLERILGPAARSGTLKVLELAAQPCMTYPPLPPLTHLPVQTTFDPAKDLAFVASANLHTLALHDFNFFHDPTNALGTCSAFDGQPFIDWLDCFPSLHTVAVYPGQWEGVDDFIMKLIVHPRVKVLYQENLRGVAWDAAVKLAAKHGVQLHHRSPMTMTVGWPMIEDV